MALFNRCFIVVDSGVLVVKEKPTRQELFVAVSC